jgi:tetratricopeptide (TPR) repeat protein
VTAVMLLAALGIVGCSKEGKTPPAKPASTDAARQAPAVKSPGVSADSAGVPSAPPKISSSFADGEAAFQARKYGEASAIFEAYTVRRPKNVWGHYMVGLSAWKGGDLAKSEQAFEQALSLDASHMKSLVNESRLFIDQQRYDEAIGRLTRASMVDPESSEVFRLLGRTYHAKGETENAIASYRAAIEVNEMDAWSMNNLGLLLVEAKRADEALPLLARATELRKDVAEFHNNFGMALEQTGRYKAAAKAYGDAVTTNPAYGKAKSNLARVEAVKSGPEEPFGVERMPTSIQPATTDAGTIAGSEQASTK